MNIKVLVYAINLGRSYYIYTVNLKGSAVFIYIYINISGSKVFVYNINLRGFKSVFLH